MILAWYVTGGYREGLKLRDGETKFVFDKELFIRSQPASMQPFLEQMMQLQLFEQFVENRMDKIQHNMADEFEQECMRATDRPSGPSSYNDLVAQMKVSQLSVCNLLYQDLTCNASDK